MSTSPFPAILASAVASAIFFRIRPVPAVARRFVHGDLASLLNAAGHQSGAHAATEEKSLTQGTSGWAGLGTNPAGATGTQEGR